MLWEGWGPRFLGSPWLSPMSFSPCRVKQWNTAKMKVDRTKLKKTPTEAVRVVRLCYQDKGDGEWEGWELFPFREPRSSPFSAPCSKTPEPPLLSCSWGHGTQATGLHIFCAVTPTDLVPLPQWCWNPGVQAPCSHTPDCPLRASLEPRHPGSLSHLLCHADFTLLPQWDWKPGVPLLSPPRFPSSQDAGISVLLSLAALIYF